MSPERMPTPEISPRRRSFLELPDDLIKIIQQLGKEVSLNGENPTLPDQVAAPNEALHAEDAIGRPARLLAEAATYITQPMLVARRKVKPGELTVSTNLGEKEQFEGIFTGCVLRTLGGRASELVYNLELPIGTEKGSSAALVERSVIANVDDARLHVEVNLPDAQVLHDERFREPMALLDAFESELITDRALQIQEAVTLGDVVDAEALNAIAFLAEEIMEQPGVVGNKQAYTAVMQLMVPLFDEHRHCSFQGIEVTHEQSEAGNIHFDTIEVEANGDIHGLQATFNFNLEDKTDIPLETMQPSLIFLDDKSVERVVPMKYLSYFAFTKESQKESKNLPHDEWRERFLKKYPKLFKK